MASDDLRALIRRACAEAEGFTFGSLEPHDYQRHADKILALVDAEVDAVAERGAAAIAAMGADVRAARAERDRYRAAWQSARQRAQAYGEGIVRLCDDRDSYKEWMEEQGERANRAEQELAAMRVTLARRDRRIEEYRESRRRWMEAAYADRRASNGVADELNQALAALQAVREAQSLGEALAAVAKHDGLTIDALAETEPPHTCGNCEGIDPGTCLNNPDRTKES